jgi:hypothetical protein
MRIGLLVLLAAGLLLLAGGTAFGASRSAFNHVTWFDAPGHERGDAVTGAFAVQQRGYFSATTQLHLKELTPGHRYTLWWVIYNNPGACTDGCGPDDLAAVLSTGTNPVDIGVHFAGTYAVSATGKLDISARILENAVSSCQTVPPYASVCEPLVDAAVAQATILVNDNGPATSDSPFVAAEAFGLGCKSYAQSGAVLATYGDTGFECYTAQSIFLP